MVTFIQPKLLSIICVFFKNRFLTLVFFRIDSRFSFVLNTVLGYKVGGANFDSAAARTCLLCRRGRILLEDGHLNQIYLL